MAPWVTGGLARASGPPAGWPPTERASSPPPERPHDGDWHHADSEEIVTVTGMGTVRTDSGKYHFFPSRWMSMDGSPDADFGVGQSRVRGVPGARLHHPDCEGRSLLRAQRKNLGGMGGQLADFLVAIGPCPSTPCPPPTRQETACTWLSRKTARHVPMGSRVERSSFPFPSPPDPHPCHGPLVRGAGRRRHGTDHHDDRWNQRCGRLVHELREADGLDGDTGTVDLHQHGHMQRGREFTSPIAVNGRIIVGGDTHLCAWPFTEALVVNAPFPAGFYPRVQWLVPPRAFSITSRRSRRWSGLPTKSRSDAFTISSGPSV